MRIHTQEQLLTTLDDVVAQSVRGDRTSRSASAYWSELLTRAGHPLATDLPDENLVDWHERGLLGDLRGRRVLDIGCGGGRNTRWFAEHGANVDGIDVASDLVAAAAGRLPTGASVSVCDVLRDSLPHPSYDVVYDSGCFHHLAPHRRQTYRERVLSVLTGGGRFGIVAFADDKVESPSDAEILCSGDVGGGIGYSPADLTAIFAPLAPVEIRAVRVDVHGAFGADFLNAALFQRLSGAV